jgi:hypothetical protein
MRTRTKYLVYATRLWLDKISLDSTALNDITMQWIDVEAVVTSYVRLPSMSRWPASCQARDFKPDIPTMDRQLFNRDIHTIKPSLF